MKLIKIYSAKQCAWMVLDVAIFNNLFSPLISGLRFRMLLMCLNMPSMRELQNYKRD